MLKSRFPVLALVVFIGLISVNWTPEEAGIRLSDPKALAQHGTSVAPVLTDAMPPGKNVLWCATFQMAWDAAAIELKRRNPLSAVPFSGFHHFSFSEFQHLSILPHVSLLRHRPQES